MDYIYEIEAPAIGTPDSSFKKLDFCFGWLTLCNIAVFKFADSEFLSYNLMLNSGRKFRALRDKKIYILTLVFSENKFLNETKNNNPPLLNVRKRYHTTYMNLLIP
jgi:hypothetical protein